MQKLLVGLGNPGREYEGTRHNVGFIFLEEFQKQYQIVNSKYPHFATSDVASHFVLRTSRDKSRGKQNDISDFKYSNSYNAEISEIQTKNIKITLMKPQTFMNRSGEAVSSYLRMYKLDPSRDLIVIHDDLDIMLGEYKIQKGKGPMLHNGIESIEKYIGTKDFTRVRIGIDNRVAENRINGEAYVLQRFDSEEIKRLPFDEISVELSKLFDFN